MPDEEFVDEFEPEPTDNGVRAEDGEQDTVSQDPEAVYDDDADED